ncbi:GntR family transcriptional regulator [Amorphus sp. MBR-141]
MEQQLTAAQTPSGPDVRRGDLPMSQQVYLTLRNELMVGEFSPGEPISLRTLARRLGTSAMPVREAVNRLIAEQALQMMPNRQVIVPFMSRHKFEELWRVRQMLESMAAEGAVAHLDDGVMDELEHLHMRSMDALLQAAPRPILSTNKDFHFRLYQASRSEVLLPMIEGLWMQMGPFMRLSLEAKTARWDGTHHVEMLQALRARDAIAVSRAVHQDISSMAEIIVEIDAFDVGHKRAS